jgi:hypothetical protein
MDTLINAGRWFFAICLAGLAGQQFYYGEFRPVFIPPWPGQFPGESLLVYLFSLFLVWCAISILWGQRARTSMLILGALCLALLLCCHIPYELIYDPASKHIGVWGNAFKDLAFAGAAFAVAGSFPDGQETTTAGSPSVLPISTSVLPIHPKTSLTRLLQSFIPLGGFFFSVTMIVFGVDHFLYPAFVAMLVPDWIPGHLFWTYFAGIALIGAGIGIILRIQLRLAGILLGVMIFLWLLFLHIPRAAVAPVTDKGNELTSVFEALGFSGIAFLIAHGCYIGKFRLAK